MLAIDQVLISEEIISEQFVCDLSRCHGGCCVEGDAGAPLTSEEAMILDEAFEQIRPFLSEESVEQINRQGTYVTNPGSGYQTPTIGNGICVYGILEHGVVKCGIEKAFEAGRTRFKKPISCHLYPIRITQYERYEAMNYEPRELLCRPACVLGDKLKIPVYRFLKEAIIRKYDEYFFDALTHFAALDKSQDQPPGSA